MSARSVPSRPGRARLLSRLVASPLLVLAAGCGGTEPAPPPAVEQPSPFADCTALTAPPAPGAVARASDAASARSNGPGRPAASTTSPGPPGSSVTAGGAAPARGAVLAAPARGAVSAALAGGAVSAALAGGAAPAGDGAELPDVTLPCFTGGQPVRLTDLRGPAVLNLWGSWCGPCREELPAVQRFADRTAGQVHVVGVDTFDSREAGGSFAADQGIHISTLYDREKRLMSALGVVNLPATVFVDRAGTTYVHLGRPLDDAGLTRLAGKHTGVTVSP